MTGFIAVFLAFLGMFIAALPPALAPYRDAGEMTASALTLGVSHPTSYPLYILLGRIAEAVPVGNPAYRLALFSALCAAAACALVYAACSRRWGRLAGLGAAALLGLNGTFWSVALVSEMYTLWILGAAALMALALRLREKYEPRLWLFFCALYGLCLTNRLDVILWAPGLIWLALGEWDTARAPLWASLAFLVFPAALVLSDKNALLVPLIVGTALWRYRGGRRAAWTLWSGAFAFAGLAVYAYLPLRSARGPWLDWNHPLAPANFLESILRSRYGGTLDLLSLNYAKGSLFGDNMVLYGKHLWSSFSAAGIALAVLGSAGAARRDPRRWLGMAACYWWSGPVFLLMANMPPNPHAAAIVDPHYLASDLVLVFWAAEGFSFMKARPARLAVAALLAVVPFLSGRWQTSARREHLFTYDYAKNVLMSVPQGGTLAVKKDVQLYTLWSYQTAQGWRPDVRVVAQGLAGSSWYREGWRRRDPQLSLGPLRSAQDWNTFSQLDAPVFATWDAELADGVSRRPWGLVSSLSPRPADAPPSFELMARRGNYDYEGQPDFFTSDLIDNYAAASYYSGAELYQKEAARALVLLKQAWAMHWLYPEPAVFLGYAAFQGKDYAQAKRYYTTAVAVAEAVVGLADAYRVLAGPAEGFRRQSAQDMTQLGAVEERLGDLDGARACYERAIARFPLSLTHYNYAVLFWNKDWGIVERELAEAVRLEPGNAQAAALLAKVRSRRKAS